MDNQQAISSIKQLIGQGNIEQALEQLVALLDSDPDLYGDLAQTARVNQADLYQIKSQLLKGAIDTEESRIATNRITDSALQLIRQLETGKITTPGAPAHARIPAWRYYVVGGVVTLATVILVWQLCGKKKNEDCPNFGDDANVRVMILPFKQTGENTGKKKPEFDILEGLTVLVDKAPGMKAIVDVHEGYDIEKNYPNPAEAADEARHCQADMVIWGRLIQSEAGKDYTLKVNYRLLDAGGVRYAGDTTISRLLKPAEQGSWDNDTRYITRQLFLVLANRTHMPIAASLMEELYPPTKDLGNLDSAPDTVSALNQAEYHLNNGESEKALALYDQILEHYPEQPTALINRGALLYEKGDWAAAARDLETAKPDLKKPDVDLQKIRADAYMKSGQPQKAEQDLLMLRDKDGVDGAWLRNKLRESKDSTLALTERAETLEKKAKTRGIYNPEAGVEAAKARLGAGDETAALRNIREVLRRDPKNVEAVGVAVEAHLQNGDTASAKKTIQDAERAGVNVKTILKQAPVIKQLIPAPVQPKDQ